MWGVFALCLAGMLIWFALRRRSALKAAVKAAALAAKEGGEQGKEGENGEVATADCASTSGPSLEVGRQEAGAGAAESERQRRDHLAEGRGDSKGGVDEDDQKKLEDPKAKGKRGVRAWWRAAGRRWDAWWAGKTLRRCVFLLRFAWLLVDVALDIRVTVWLFGDGARTEGAVCAAFLALAQAAVALVAFANVVPLLLGSLCSVLVLAPAMLLVMPVLAPVLAVWNVWNPDIPMVFWRWVRKPSQAGFEGRGLTRRLGFELRSEFGEWRGERGPPEREREREFNSLISHRCLVSGTWSCLSLP
jgi:hypothetical protein